MCEHTFVPLLSYVVTEYDPAKPWIIVGREQRTVELDDAASFAGWARENWPAPRYAAELDPGQAERLL